MCVGGLSVVVFSKYSQSISPKVEQIIERIGSLQGKLSMREQKKPAGLLRPADLNFKRRPTNSYLLETIAQTVAMD